jgi:small subunit ribosomal protein S17
MENKRVKRQVTGTVLSNKMDKTIIVLAERLMKHKVYHKYIKRRVRYAAHDENNLCNIGDKVQITESRPISRNKRWRVSKIIERAV